MLWGGSEGGEPSGGLGPGGGELELDLDDNSGHDDGVGPGRGNAVTVGNRYYNQVQSHQ